MYRCVRYLCSCSMGLPKLCLFLSFPSGVSNSYFIFFFSPFFFLFFKSFVLYSRIPMTS